MAGSTETLELAHVAHGGGLTGCLGQASKRGVSWLAETRVPASVSVNATAGALEKLGAQPFLQLADMAADGGMGHEQLGRRPP